ncbi:MAG: 4a-hydroxytetrahydrobiopterin dehydratase [Actinomycetota bacterium]|nr:4a-hydroxytetrahydrobiopterin dehydratase [Actinomycetota bacterium]
MELLDDAELNRALPSLWWRREGRQLIKVVRRQDFAEALAYVNLVGALAEQAGHHPDVEISWNTVTLRLSTHSLGGITDADLSLARRIDALPT